MTLRDRFLAGLAGQLGRPEGVRGRLLSKGLNRGNRAMTSSAVHASGLGPGGRGADVGFGGVVGLYLLLGRVGASGHVDGVDLSETMVRAAVRRYRTQCAAGRLTIRQGTLLDLPLDDASIDGLITVNTIYFVDDLMGAMKEVARTLAPTGKAVLGIADPEAMAEMPFTAHGFRIRPVGDVIDTVRGAGMHVVGYERVGSGDRAGHLLVCSRTEAG
jgi:ubiquinone/menaquinone biosynthesis C-methylase UbiE